MSVLALLSLLLLCAAHPRQNFRCLYYKGECVPHCPRNMHPYHTRCDQDALSQRTCSSRYVYPIGFTCGWSRCDCNADLLLDEELMRCVKEEECPEPGLRRRKSRRRLHLPDGRDSEEMFNFG
ncbi:uncharacterized protein LOC133523777 isoform X2 [Cydia pomonella]|uniref:uncharacterized protein LOC133523777 isoform X2 n=1 Tax=Cydia pomonella TaxID=82600 RepID=UPI002ADE3AA3|nr:uncharacterized protein LOC133523777 isoform X2 [Cydia pomonella]